MHRHITKQMRRRLILPSSREFQSDLSHPRSHVRSVDLAFPPEAASLRAFSLSPLSFSPTVINACIHRFRQLVAPTNAAASRFGQTTHFRLKGAPRRRVGGRKERRRLLTDSRVTACFVWHLYLRSGLILPLQSRTCNSRHRIL